MTPAEREFALERARETLALFEADWPRLVAHMDQARRLKLNWQRVVARLEEGHEVPESLWEALAADSATSE